MAFLLSKIYPVLCFVEQRIVVTCSFTLQIRLFHFIWLLWEGIGMGGFFGSHEE
jgi:hypothetical protein